MSECKTYISIPRHNGEWYAKLMVKYYEQSVVPAELDYIEDKSHWFELFGTPERAAQTLFEIKCGEKSCKGCLIAEPCTECDVMLDGGEALRTTLLEWLRDDAEWLD